MGLIQKIKNIIFNKYRIESALFGLIFFIGLPLRLYELGNRSLWFDEADVVLDSVNIVNAFKILDLHNPIIGYKTFIFYWHQLCPYMQEWLFRLPSVIFAIAAIFLIFKLATLLFNQEVGLISSFLLAISPLHIYYSQEAVAYSFLTFSAIATIYCLARLMRGSHPSYFYLYILLNILNIYMHPVMWVLFFIESIILIAGIKKLKEIYKKIILGNLIVLIFSIPWFCSVVLGRDFLFEKNNFYFERAAGYIPLPTWINGYLLFKNFVLGFNAPGFIYPIATLIFLMLFLKGFEQLIKKVNGRAVLLITLLPPVLIFFVAKITQVSYFLDRYFVFLLPFFLMVIAFALWKFKKTKIKILLIGIISVLSVFSLVNYYRDILPFDVVAVPTKKEIREAAAHISKSLQKNDLILHTCRNTALPFEYYFDFYFNKTPDILKDYPERKINKQYIIYCEKLDAGAYFYKYMMRDKVLQSEYVFLKDYEVKNERIFLVFSKWKFEDSSIPEIYALKWLEKKYKIESRKNFNGVTVYLLIKKDQSN